MGAPRKDYSKAVELYQAGMSCRDIAKFLGKHHNSIWYALRRRIKLRPQERTGKDNHFWRNGSRASDRAQNLAEVALHKGVLQRPDKCQSCGASGHCKNGATIVHGHHDDYSKPLDVRWLCKKCHFAWHAENTAKPA